MAGIALIGLGVSEAVLGAEWARRVLLFRPFAVAYSALLIALLWQTRRHGTPTAVLSDKTVTHLPRGFLNARGP